MSENNSNGLGLGQSKDPFEAAATMFGLFKYKFERYVRDLNTEQLRALNMSLITDPTDSVHISPDQAVVDTYNFIKSNLQNREMMVTSFKERVDTLSTGQLRRLANALVQYPLSDKIFIEINSNSSLKEANNIGQRMLEAKSMMFLEAVSEYQAAQMAESQESAPVSDDNKAAGE